VKVTNSSVKLSLLHRLLGKWWWGQSFHQCKNIHHYISLSEYCYSVTPCRKSRLLVPSKTPSRALSALLEPIRLSSALRLALRVEEVKFVFCSVLLLHQKCFRRWRLDLFTFSKISSKSYGSTGCSVCGSGSYSYPGSDYCVPIPGKSIFCQSKEALRSNTTFRLHSRIRLRHLHHSLRQRSPNNRN